MELGDRHEWQATGVATIYVEVTDDLAETDGEGCTFTYLDLDLSGDDTMVLPEDIVEEAEEVVEEITEETPEQDPGNFIQRIIQNLISFLKSLFG